MYKEMKKELIITPETKIGELLEAFPALEKKLIEVAPQFNKLKNPVLRKTIAKIATIRQAALIGNIKLTDLINLLREEVGQKLENFVENSKVSDENISDLIKGKKVVTYDARMDLENSEHPLKKVMSDLNDLKAEEIYLLITPFLPAPLIEVVKVKGFTVKIDNTDSQLFKTYIFR
jgi:hypothetical protein